MLAVEPTFVVLYRLIQRVVSYRSLGRSPWLVAFKVWISRFFLGVVAHVQSFKSSRRVRTESDGEAGVSTYTLP